MTLDKAIEHAAEHLPEGYYIELCVENGSAWVNLVTPHDVISIEPCDESLPQIVKRTTHMAINHSKE